MLPIPAAHVARRAAQQSLS